MVKFKVKFTLYDGAHFKIPRTLKHGDSFWCSFNVIYELATCKLIYLGDDEYMQQYREYEGTITLLDGKKYLDDLQQEHIYKLNCGSEVVGECVLKELL